MEGFPVILYSQAGDPADRQKYVNALTEPNMWGKVHLLADRVLFSASITPEALNHAGKN